MSFQLMSWAATQRTGSGTNKAVLMALANAANHHSGTCRPSIEYLAEETEFSEATVKRALKDLVDAGFITRTRRRRGDGSLGTYEYEFPRGTERASQGSESALGSEEAPQITRGHSDPAEPGEDLVQERTPEPGPLAPAAREYDPRKGVKIAGRNLPWDALVEATHADERVESGRIAAALKSIRLVASADLNLGSYPELDESTIASEIRVRAKLYRERWPTVELTPTALAANWSRVLSAAPGRTAQGAYEIAVAAIEEDTT